MREAGPTETQENDMLLKYVLIACAALAVSGSAALANGKKERICRMVEMCTNEEVPPTRSEVPPPRKVEKVVEKTEDACVTACLSHAAWAACKSKSWYANMKGHGKAEPLNNRATKYSTARFFDRCGTDCRKPGTMRFGYHSKRENGGTDEWTVFRYGHSDDPK
jgi:hypothetical protein